MKTLTRDIARQQAARLQASAMLAPQSDEGRREIVDCIMRNCQSTEHATTVMTALLEECRDPRNLTAELVAIARATRLEDGPPPGCASCSAGEDVNGVPCWLPFVIVERNGYSSGRRCTCERGRWLAARDKQRELDAQSSTPKRELAKVEGSECPELAG